MSDDVGSTHHELSDLTRVDDEGGEVGAFEGFAPIEAEPTDATEDHDVTQ